MGQICVKWFSSLNMLSIIVAEVNPELVTALLFRDVPEAPINAVRQLRKVKSNNRGLPIHAVCLGSVQSFTSFMHLHQVEYNSPSLKCCCI